MLGIFFKWLLEKFGVSFIKSTFKCIIYLRQCIVCSIIVFTICLGVFYFIVYIYHFYSTYTARAKMQEAFQMQQKLVASCETQNCFGIGVFEEKSLRFIQVWCKDKVGAVPYEITHIPFHWYSAQSLKKINNSASDLWYLLDKMPTNEPLGIMSHIYKDGNHCEYNTSIAHHNTQKIFQTSQSKVFDGEWVKTPYNVPFFVQDVLPNLNTKCNPNYNSIYAETDFKITWIMQNNKQFFLWWSFNEEGKCSQNIARNDIFNAMSGISTQLNASYDKINITEFLKLKN